jgi:hypothetical protein
MRNKSAQSSKLPSVVELGFGISLGGSWSYETLFLMNPIKGSTPARMIYSSGSSKASPLRFYSIPYVFGLQV